MKPPKPNGYRWLHRGYEFRSVAHMMAAPWLFLVWCLTLGRACKNWKREAVEEWTNHPMPSPVTYNPGTR
jgi:hypothetical protein